MFVLRDKSVLVCVEINVDVCEELGWWGDMFVSICHLFIMHDFKLYLIQYASVHVNSRSQHNQHFEDKYFQIKLMKALFLLNVSLMMISDSSFSRGAMNAKVALDMYSTESLGLHRRVPAHGARRSPLR